MLELLSTLLQANIWFGCQKASAGFPFLRNIAMQHTVASKSALTAEH